MIGMIQLIFAHSLHVRTVDHHWGLQGKAQNRIQNWLPDAYLVKLLVQVAQVKLRVADQCGVLPAMLPISAWEHFQFLPA